jgi:HEAT repeat protein
MRTKGIKTIAIAALALFLVPLPMRAVQSGGQGTKTTAPQYLDDILKRLATYEGGLNSEAFWSLRNYVLAYKDVAEARLACEEKLLAFLGSEATSVAKMAVCRQLRVIGGERSVPVLEKMLLQKETSDMARYALEKIPADAADKALLNALPTSKGDIKLGIISSLGQRKTQAAVSMLGAMILDSKNDIASAVVFALGRIGGKEAAGVLTAALGKTKGELQAQIGSALLVCAENFMALKDAGAAAGIYNQLLGPKLPAALRRAAMSGKIAAAGDQAASVILAALEGADQDMKMPAIGMVKKVFDASSITPICALLPELPESGQVQLLAVLAEYPASQVLAPVLQAARSPQEPVRMAGLKALEKVGDASSVAFLAEAAAKSQRKEQEIARTSLWGLKGREVDEEVISLMAKQPADDVLNELLMSIGERRIFAGKAWLVMNEESSSAKVRQTALRALKVIGTPSDVPGLLDLLVKTENEQEQAEIENAVVALARKISNPLARSGAVKGKLDKEKDIKNKSKLFHVLGRIGDDSALPLLREALMDPDAEVVDAAVRALAIWPTVTAKDDVLQINRTAKNEVHEILTLQAYVRLVGLERFRSPESAVRDLKLAFSLSDRPEEKRLVLGILPNFACPDAQGFAESLLEFDDIKAEAQVAVDKIKKKLEKEEKK